MTRDEISDLVTKTVGQTDSASLALCNTFVQRGYEMCWNAELWRDTIDVDTSATITVGNNSFNLPSGFERIVSLQALSAGIPVGLLEPTTSTFILQTEPTALTSNGIPTKYEEYTSSGTKKVRIFPKADGSYSFTMSGKRVCPTLGASDNLQIRNIDNVVVALATSYMYKRMRQLGKAGEAAKEAGAYLEQAKAIEHAQSNQVRTSKQLTVAGNSLQEMADAVSARTGQYTPDAMILIKDFLRRNYQQVYDSNLWSESALVLDVISALGALIMPEYVDRVISIRGNANLGQLSVAQPSVYFGINPWIFEQTGDPITFAYLTPVALPRLPTTAELLTLASAVASDKTPVFIRGEDNSGNILSESITLNGTTGVNTANAYKIPLTIAKNITLGQVTVTGVTSLIQYGYIYANERERKHIRIWLQPTPTANLTCKVLCKRRIAPLVQDEDTPILRDIGNVLINLAAADMFSKLGNKDGALDARGKAEEALKTLISLEMMQGANSAQVVPEVEYAGADWIDSDAWIVAK